MLGATNWCGFYSPISRNEVVPREMMINLARQICFDRRFIKERTTALAIIRIGVGRRMSQAVVHGDTIYLAGQVAHDAKGQSVAAQTSDILAQIDFLLSEAGTNKCRLLMANIWLADMSTFTEMNAVWDAWVVEGETPGRATVEAKLAGPQYAVEIAVIAAR